MSKMYNNQYDGSSFDHYNYLYVCLEISARGIVVQVAPDRDSKEVNQTMTIWGR